MNPQELRNLQEAYYYDVYYQLDESRGADLRAKHGDNPSKKLDAKAFRKAMSYDNKDRLSTGTGTELRARYLGLSGRAGSRARGQTPESSAVSPDGQSRTVRSRGGKPTGIGAGENRDRGSENRTQREQVDIYDIILSHLLDEGYAETPEAAEVIMVNMSEEWRESIMEGPGGMMMSAASRGEGSLRASTPPQGGATRPRNPNEGGTGSQSTRLRMSTGQEMRRTTPTPRDAGVKTSKSSQPMPLKNPNAPGPSTTFQRLIRRPDTTTIR